MLNGRSPGGAIGSEMHPEVRQVVEELNPAQLVLEACLCPAPDLYISFVYNVCFSSVFITIRFE